MIRIKSDLKPYAIEVPTDISEIDIKYFNGLLNDIKLANNYGIIAICYYDKISSLALDMQLNGSKSVPVVPIIAKIATDTDCYPFKVGDLAVINKTALEMGTHLYLTNNALSVNALKEYILEDKDITNAILKGDFYTKEIKEKKNIIFDNIKTRIPDKIIGVKQGINIYMIEFKIIPLNDIRASYSQDANIVCTKVEYEKSNLN